MSDNPRGRMRTKTSRHGEAGYTLVELLVVLGIIVLLGALVAPQVLRYLNDARSDSARVQLRNIESALELYYLDAGAYPSTEQGLNALLTAPGGATPWRGPYLKQIKGIIDPWGVPFRYASPGQHGAFDLSTLGRDKAEGGEGENKDHVSW